MTRKLFVGAFIICCALMLIAHDKVAAAQSSIIAEALFEQGDEHWYEAQLDDVSKQFYNAMKALYENGLLEKGVGSINILDYGIGIDQITEYVNGSSDLLNAFNDAKLAFEYDHPEIFYVDYSKITFRVLQTENGYEAVVGNGAYDVYLLEEFSSEKEVLAAVSEYSQMKELILENIDSEADTETKLNTIYDILFNQISYTGQEINDQGQLNNHAYSALIRGAANSTGYAKAFKSVLDDLGIPCVLVEGIGITAKDGQVLHTWLNIEIENIWYAMDIAWDNIEETEPSYLYYLSGSEIFDEDHKRTPLISHGGTGFYYPLINNIDYKNTAVDLYLDTSQTDYPTIITSYPSRTSSIRMEEQTIEITFDEPFERISKDIVPLVSVVNEAAEYNYTVRNFTWENREDTCVMRFEFIPDIDQEEITTTYTFQISGLQGSVTGKEPKVFSYKVKDQDSIISYSQSLNTLPGYQLTTPVLISADSVTQEDKEPQEEPILITNKVNSEEQTLLYETLKKYLDPETQVLSDENTDYYQISMIDSNGSTFSFADSAYMTIAFPYPQDYVRLATGDTSISIFYFNQLSDGSYEIHSLPVIETNNCLVTVGNDSGFYVVSVNQTDTLKETAVNRSLVLYETGNGRVYMEGEDNAKYLTSGMYTSEEADQTTYYIQPDDGYLIERIIINNTEIDLGELDINADFQSCSLTFQNSGNQPMDRIIKVYFVAKESLLNELEQDKILADPILKTLTRTLGTNNGSESVFEEQDFEILFNVEVDWDDSKAAQEDEQGTINQEDTEEYDPQSEPVEDMVMDNGEDTIIDEQSSSDKDENTFEESTELKTDVIENILTDDETESLTESLTITEDDADTETLSEAQAGQLGDTILAEKETETSVIAVETENSNINDAAALTYVPMTLGNGKIALAGKFLPDTTLTISDQVSEETKSLFYEYIDKDSVLLVYELTLSKENAHEGTMELTFVVDKAFEGKTLDIYHYVNGEMEVVSKEVSGNSVSIAIDSLSPFAITFNEAADQTSNSVHTGDSNMLVIWAVTLIGCILVIGIIIIKNKKHS